MHHKIFIKPVVERSIHLLLIESSSINSFSKWLLTKIIFRLFGIIVQHLANKYILLPKLSYDEIPTLISGIFTY